MRRELAPGTVGRRAAQASRRVPRDRLGLCLGLLGWALMPGMAAAQQPPTSPATPPAAADTAPLDAPEIEIPRAQEPATQPTTAPTEAAGQSEETPEIVLQLNNLQPIQPAGCRFTFLATNNREAPIERLGVELVVFDAQRRVDQFLVLEFTRLAAKKTKVSQFDLAERSCSDVSQLLVNDVVNCGIEEGATPTCAERVKLENLTDIDLAY